MAKHKISFHRKEGPRWNGNGFGTDSAHWYADLAGREVGTWHKDASGWVTATIDGEPVTVWHLRSWKHLVLERFSEK